MRVLRWAAVVLLAIAVALLAAFLWYRQASLPEHEGTLRLAGLAAPVTIARDARGVPHIRAASETDALFGLGYAHAQDRLWQLEFDRRVTQGRLAEILGHDALDTDRMMRTLGIYREAQRIASRLDPESRALIDAYRAGINAYLHGRPVLPPEFVLTGTPAPADWAVEDTVAWSMMMAWDEAAIGFYNELARLRLTGRFSKAEIDDIRPPYPGADPLPVADYVALYRRLGLPQQALAAQAEALAALRVVDPFGRGPGLGSNCWVVAGSHTRSGKPLLANDPHMDLSSPSVWYFAQLQAPGLEVFGGTLPGIPYVLLGRNRHVAWGFTNTYADEQDLYLEQVDAADPTRYRTPAGSAPFGVHDETIVVRGEDPVVLHLRTTRHGPVMSDAVEPLRQALPATTTYVVSLRWTAYEGVDHTLRALRGMNRAADARQFEQALRDFTIEVQNVAFADDAGHIGFVAAGRVPVRGPGNDLYGVAPAPGWEARYDWQGWLPFEELPRLIDPPDGVIVTANHRITPPGYRHFITSEWNLPYRAQRIRMLLDAQDRHDAASFERIQADQTSLAARDFLELLRATEPATPGGRAALALLRAWDGGMRADRPEPLLFHAWLRRLRARLFTADFGPLADSFLIRNEMTRFTLDVLAGTARARDWCADAAAAGGPGNCAGQAALALDEAVAELTGSGARELASLRWGEVHRAVFEHRPFSYVPGLRSAFELGVGVGGDTFTIDVGTLRLRGEHPYFLREGPSLRAVYDLGDGGGAWMFAPGEVGNPFSEHYGDLLADWREVRYQRLDWAPPTPQVLVLKPAARP